MAFHATHRSDARLWGRSTTLVVVPVNLPESGNEILPVVQTRTDKNAMLDCLPGRMTVAHVQFTGHP